MHECIISVSAEAPQVTLGVRSRHRGKRLAPEDTQLMRRRIVLDLDALTRRSNMSVAAIAAKTLVPKSLSARLKR